MYARICRDEVVLVMLNGSDSEQIVPMSRFSEVIGDNVAGTDVITGDYIELKDSVKIAPRGVYVLELE